LSSLQQPRIISVQVMTEKESVDESYHLFRIGLDVEFLGFQNTALRYTAVHGSAEIADRHYRDDIS